MNKSCGLAEGIFLVAGVIVIILLIIFNGVV